MSITPGTSCSLLHRSGSFRLTKIIQAGGEGQVWETDLSGQVAKIFFPRHPSTREPLLDRAGDEPLPPMLINKLKRMIGDPPVDPGTKNGGAHRWIAWPTDIVVRKHGGRDIPVGFIMPRAASGSEVLLKAFNPLHRARFFPHFTFNYAIAIAHNVSAVFKELHNKAYVIGDVNDLNVMVSPEGLVTVIDNDSVQVIVPGPPEERYLNTMGRIPWQPPEYHEIDRRNTPRTAYMDRFGLAVLVHQILFAGEHPFHGKWLGAGVQPDDDVLIRAGHYTEKAGSLMARRPAAVSRAVVSPEIMRLFEAAFISGLSVPSLRPTAEEWCAALDTLNSSLAGCPTYPNRHQFFKGSPACPWCDALSRGNNAFGVAITPKPRFVTVPQPTPPARIPVAAPRLVTRSRLANLRVRWHSSRMRIVIEAMASSILLAVVFAGLRAVGAWSGAMPQHQMMTQSASATPMFTIESAVASSVLLGTVLAPIFLAVIARRRT